MILSETRLEQIKKYWGRHGYDVVAKEQHDLDTKECQDKIKAIFERGGEPCYCNPERHILKHECPECWQKIKRESL